MSEQLEKIVKELFDIVDSVECSDNNRYFHPTELHFSSCRVMSGQRIGAILMEMKQIVGAKPRMSEKEMFLMNNPTDCGECLGTGFKDKHSMIHCVACGGTGSTEPDAQIICYRCKGTGDTQNHERESNDCTLCNTTGHIKKCDAPDCSEGTIKLVMTSDWHDCKACDGTGWLPAKDW